MRFDVEYKPKSRRNSVELCVQHAVQFTGEQREELAGLEEIKREIHRIQQKDEARLANAKIEGLEPKPLLEIEKEANDRYLHKTFGQISFSSRRSRCVSAVNSQSSIRTQGEALDTCSSTSKAHHDSTQGTDCTHVPSQEEEDEERSQGGLGSRFMFDTLASSGRSAVSRTGGFLIDGDGHPQDEGEGEEDEGDFESPRSTTDGSLYMLGDAWAEEEVRHFGQVISAPLNSTKSQPASKPSTRPASTAGTPRGPLEPPSPASAPVLPNPSSTQPNPSVTAARVAPKTTSVAGMLDRIKQQISAWDGRHAPKRAGSTGSASSSTSRATSRAGSVSGWQETASRPTQPASGSSVATASVHAASQLMQPHPPSVDPPATPSRPSTEDRFLGARRRCSSSRSFKASSQPSSCACSREFGRTLCNRRSMDSAEMPPTHFFRQASRPSQDRSSLPLSHAPPDLGGASASRAVWRPSLDLYTLQHHSERIPSVCARRSLDMDSIQPPSGLLALQHNPRVRSRSSCMTPADMARGLSNSQPLKGPSTLCAEFAGPPGTPARGTFYRPGVDQSSTSSSLASTPKASPKMTNVAAATACEASELLASIRGHGQEGAQQQQQEHQQHQQHQQPSRRRKSVSIMLHRKSKSTVSDVISDVLPV